MECRTRFAANANFLAIILLVFLPLTLNILTTIPELSRRAPYEDWDEICSYNHTRQMPWKSFIRVPSYGSLDTFEFMLARTYHQLFDRNAQDLQKSLWANGVPLSFGDNHVLLGTRIWTSYAAIDYNYARGICDRSVILTARKIDFALTCLLLGLLISFIIYTLGFPGVTVCIPLTWLVFAPEFRWALVRAIPGAQATILEGAIFFLVVLALVRKSFKLLCLAIALCAVSTNLKADAFMMSGPIFMGIFLLHVNSCPAFSLRTCVVRFFGAIGVFFGALIITNLQLIGHPIQVIKRQVDLLFAVGSSQKVDLPQNGRLFLKFLDDNIIHPFVSDFAPDESWKWVFLSVGLIILGLLFTFASVLSWRIRFNITLTTFVTLGVLWGMPIYRVPILYGRYLLPGLVVFIVAFGFALYLFVLKWRIERLIPVWGILVLGTFICFINAGPMIKSSLTLQRALTENLGLDPAISRNRAILEIWKLFQTGKYDQRVIVDQHSYLDLRFFFDRHIAVVMINAWNFPEILDGLKGSLKPILGLHVPGAYQDKTVPSWVGHWTSEWGSEYDEFHRALSSLPRFFNFDGNKMKLLDWSPVLGDDSVFVFAYDPNGVKTEEAP
jgi:hypothetical protein